jgi:hypothetical protein
MRDDGWTSTVFSSTGWVSVFCSSGVMASQQGISDPELVLARAGVSEEETIGMQTLCPAPAVSGLIPSFGDYRL